MRTTNLLLKTAVASFPLLLGCFLFTKCNTSSATSYKPGKENTLSVVNNDKVCKLIKAQEIKGAIAKSKSKKIILNIYPVKLSNDPTKKDFDLKIFFQDAAVNNKNIGTKINYKLFETQSGWYVRFLKDKNVPKDKIPFGYFLEADSTFIQSKIGVSFCLVPGQEKMEYSLFAAKPDPKEDKKGSKDDPKTVAKDSTCKCPPDCCKYLLIKSDSTGKCPPDCTGIPLLLEPIVKTVIAKNF